MVSKGKLSLLKHRHKPQQFLGPRSYGRATEYARQWSRHTDEYVCLWEPAELATAEGPYYVRRWSDPWPGKNTQLLCVFRDGRNMPDIAFMFDAHAARHKNDQNVMIPPSNRSKLALKSQFVALWEFLRHWRSRR